MDVVPSGIQYIRKKKIKFGDRMRGNLNIFGFYLRKPKKANSTDVETYEEFDTDPDEDLSIIPPWLKNRPFYKSDLEDFIQLSRKFMKYKLQRGKLRSKTSMFQTEKQSELVEICTLKCIFLEEKPGFDIQAKQELYSKLMKPK